MKIVGTKENSEKRFNADTEDHCISKHARISSGDRLSFPFNPSMGNCLHTVKQILEGDMGLYEIVDLKVKIPYLFGYKPISAISRDPKLLTLKINLINTNCKCIILGYKPRAIFGLEVYRRP